MPTTATTHDEIPFRFEPLRALRALKALTLDPDDTSQVFTLIESFSFRAPRKVMRAFRASPSGRKLLASKPDLVALLEDRDALRALPEGTLGRAYLAFVEREGITAGGLVAASEEGRRAHEATPDLEYVASRLRDTHDLWHTVTGYHGDLVGEAALLAFNVPQTWNPGVALIVLVGLLRLHDLGATKAIVGGWLRGRRAEWLVDVDWESLLALPLDEVRRRLGVRAAPAYTELRTDVARADGKLPPRQAAVAAA